MKLLRLQQQDLLDVEGASLVFKKLVEVLGGQEERALEMIGKEQKNGVGKKSLLTLVFFNSILSLILPLPSPFSPAKTEEALLQPHTDLNTKYSGILAGPLGQDMRNYSSPFLHKMYENSLESIAQLDEKECVSLLVGWLMALAASDASIMVSLRKAEGKSEERTQG